MYRRNVLSNFKKIAAKLFTIILFSLKNMTELLLIVAQLSFAHNCNCLGMPSVPLRYLHKGFNIRAEFDL